MSDTGQPIDDGGGGQDEEGRKGQKELHHERSHGVNEGDSLTKEKCRADVFMQNGGEWREPGMIMTCVCIKVSMELTSIVIRANNRPGHLTCCIS